MYIKKYKKMQWKWNKKYCITILRYPLKSFEWISIPITILIDKSFFFILFWVSENKSGGSMEEAFEDICHSLWPNKSCPFRHLGNLKCHKPSDLWQTANLFFAVLIPSVVLFVHWK